MQQDLPGVLVGAAVVLLVVTPMAGATCMTSCETPVHTTSKAPSLLQVQQFVNRATVGRGADGLGLVTLVSVECNSYFDWLMLTLYSSWRDAEVPGRLVRLVACDDPERVRLSDLEGLETHVHDTTSTEYPPLNKPSGILSWLTEGGGQLLPPDTVIMLMDADMVFFDRGAQGTLGSIVSRLRSGAATAVGNDYFYTVAGLRAKNWSLAQHFNVSNFEGLQSIGVPLLMRIDTFRSFAPEYLRITWDIVHDKGLHALVHDGREPAPWIAEMVGYTLASARIIHETQEQWPILDTPQPPYSTNIKNPLLVHYPHVFHLCGKVFGKRLYYRTDLLNCSLESKLLADLQPPSKKETTSPNCQLCITGGDVFGSDATCNLPAEGKQFSLFAWEQVHRALNHWKLEHCTKA